MAAPAAPGKRAGGEQELAPPSLPRKPSAVLEAVAGCVAGCVTAITMSPLDVIRTRLQVQKSITLPPDMIAGSPAAAFRLIWRHEGGRGFFRGLQATTIAMTVFWSGYFPVYAYAKDVLSRDEDGAAPPSKWRVALQQGGAATAAAFTADVFTNPLWVARTRLQTQWLHAYAAQTAGGAAASAGQLLYRGPLHTLRVMAKTEGLASWWKGLVPTFLGVSQVALQLPLYERMKSWVVASENRLLTLPAHERPAVLAAAAQQKARFRSAALETEAELAASAAAIAGAELGDPADAFLLPPGAFETGDPALAAARAAATVADGDDAGAGAGSSAATAAAAAAVAAGTVAPSTVGLLTASVCSKVAASLVTYPHEVLRARLQDQRSGGYGHGHGGAEPPPQFSGVVDCARKTWRAEGVRGLWAGFSVSLLRSAPAAAITFLVYEKTIRQLQAWTAEQAQAEQAQRGSAVPAAAVANAAVPVAVPALPADAPPEPAAGSSGAAATAAAARRVRQ